LVREKGIAILAAAGFMEIGTMASFRLPDASTIIVGDARDEGELMREAAVIKTSSRVLPFVACSAA
jgi:hypothetical protein